MSHCPPCQLLPFLLVAASEEEEDFASDSVRLDSPRPLLPLLLLQTALTADGNGTRSGAQILAQTACCCLQQLSQAEDELLLRQPAWTKQLTQSVGTGLGPGHPFETLGCAVSARGV